MKRKRNELEEVMFGELKNNIQSNNNLRQLLRNDLLQNRIPPSVTQEVIDGSIELSGIDLSLLALLTITLYKITENETLNPEIYFEHNEIKLAKNYQGYNPDEQIKYPLIFENVLTLTSEDYITTIDVKDIISIIYNSWSKKTYQSKKYIEDTEKIHIKDF